MHEPSPSWTLETERLILRPMVVTDAPAFFALDTDPDVYRFTGESPPTSVAEVEQRIASYPDYKDYGFGRMACVLRKTSDTIGFCGLKKLPELDGEIDIGYRLTPAHWGQGLATEASLTMMQFGFDTLNLTRIIGLVDPANQRSIRVLEKLGMTYERDIEYFGQPAKRFARHHP